MIFTPWCGEVITYILCVIYYGAVATPFGAMYSMWRLSAINTTITWCLLLLVGLGLAGWCRRCMLVCARCTPTWCVHWQILFRKRCKLQKFTFFFLFLTRVYNIKNVILLFVFAQKNTTEKLSLAIRPTVSYTSASCAVLQHKTTTPPA